MAGMDNLWASCPFCMQAFDALDPGSKAVKMRMDGRTRYAHFKCVPMLKGTEETKGNGGAEPVKGNGDATAKGEIGNGAYKGRGDTAGPDATRTLR